MVSDFVPGGVKLTDVTVVLYSQGISVYQCPRGFILLEKLGQGTKSYMAEDRSVYIYRLAVQRCWWGAVSGGEVPSSLYHKTSWAARVGCVCGETLFPPQCCLPRSLTDLLLERSDRILILISGKI